MYELIIVDDDTEASDNLGNLFPREENGLPANSISDKIIIKIKQYIQENYITANLTSIANHAKMNPSYLSRYFKEKTGNNLSSYITRIRMEQALLLLQNETIRTIQEVCEYVGYSNAVSFSKTFIRQYGITPTNYRRNFSQIHIK